MCARLVRFRHRLHVALKAAFHAERFPRVRTRKSTPVRRAGRRRPGHANPSFCQNGQSRGRRFRALGSGVLGADCTATCSGWPMRNRCGTVSTNVFSTE